MMAEYGLSVKNYGLNKIYLSSLLVIYRKCFIHRLLFGLAAKTLNEKEIEELEAINKRLLRNVLSLPSSTPVVALYKELQVAPLRLELWKRKLRMWNRLNRDSCNDTLKEMKRCMISEDLPWIKDLISIGLTLNIDIKEGMKMQKRKWKKLIETKCSEWMTPYIEKEIEKTKRYKENIDCSRKMSYEGLPLRLAQVMFRGRANLLDPAPRLKDKEKKWQCIFCRENSQTTRHYVLNCRGLNDIPEETRKATWEGMRSGGNIEETSVCARTLEMIYKKIKKEKGKDPNKENKRGDFTTQKGCKWEYSKRKRITTEDKGKDNGKKNEGKKKLVEIKKKNEEQCSIQ